MIIETEEVKEIAKEIQYLVQDIVPEGVEITMDYYHGDIYSTGGGLSYRKDRSVASKLRTDEIKRSCRKLTAHCPCFERMHLSFERANEPLVSLFEVEDFIKDIRRRMMKEIVDENYEKMEILAKFDAVAPDRDAKCEITESIRENGKTFIDDYSLLIDDFQFLYYKLERRPGLLKVRGNREEVIFESDRAYPEWGIRPLSKEDTEAIREDQSKVLRFILSDNIGEDFISYSYLRDKETRAFVDFLGGLVKEHLDMDAYIRAAGALKDEASVQAYFTKNKAGVREKITARVKNRGDDQYKAACNKLLNMGLERVLFEKTAFHSANQSEYLREYMFFLGMIAEGRLLFDIHQSEAPQLTEVFWLLEEVPETNWSDVSPEYPPSPLEFNR